MFSNLRGRGGKWCMLLKISFKAIKNKNKSKRLKIERVTPIFVSQVGRNLIFWKFSNVKISLSFWDLAMNFCVWYQYLYRHKLWIATWCLRQLFYWFPDITWNHFKSPQSTLNPFISLDTSLNPFEFLKTTKDPLKSLLDRLMFVSHWIPLNPLKFHTIL